MNIREESERLRTALKEMPCFSNCKFTLLSDNCVQANFDIIGHHGRLACFFDVALIANAINHVYWISQEDTVVQGNVELYHYAISRLTLELSRYNIKLNKRLGQHNG